MTYATTALWLGALLPLAVVAALHRGRPAGAMLVALAFAMSFAGDMLAALMGGAWEAYYLYLPVQMILVLAALLPSRRLVWWAGLALGLCMAYDVVVQSAGPDMLITVVGSAMVVTLALLTMHPLRVSILLYFGTGSAFYLAMVQQIGTGGFMPWWWAYQGARVAAWAAFVVVVLRAWGWAREARQAPVKVPPHMEFRRAS